MFDDNGEAGDLFGDILGGRAIEDLSQTGLAALPKNEKSMLDRDTLEKLSDAMASLPSAFLNHAAGNLTSTQSIVDFATTVCMSVADGKIKVSQSAELRKWAELMYSCIATNKNGNNTQVNYIGQLVQLAGADPVEDREIIEVQEAIVRPKKAQGE